MICDDIDSISINLLKAVKNKRFIQVFFNGMWLRGLLRYYDNITGDFVVEYILLTIKHNICNDIFRIL